LEPIGPAKSGKTRSLMGMGPGLANQDAVGRVYGWCWNRANNGILAGDDPAFNMTNTENDSEMKKQAEERKLHRMAMVHDF